MTALLWELPQPPLSPLSARARRRMCLGARQPPPTCSLGLVAQALALALMPAAAATPATPRASQRARCPPARLPCCAVLRVCAALRAARWLCAVLWLARGTHAATAPPNQTQGLRGAHAAPLPPSRPKVYAALCMQASTTVVAATSSSRVPALPLSAASPPPAAG